jgi:hypothetical protein
MKIYMIPVSHAFQPVSQTFRYPSHNDSYDVEQDFLIYMSHHPELLTTLPEEADWFYLPIFWTRWHMSHNYATTGLIELQDEVTRVLNDVKRTFTVCLYEDGPLVDIGATVLLTATRKPTTVNGIDIPTLCASHRAFPVEKQYRASFVGRLRTNMLRREMSDVLTHRSDVLIQDGDFGEHVFVETLSASYLALCPSGGSGSFRFYEAMQLGIAPLLIHELDVRPFKQRINWDSCSLHLTSVAGIEKAVDKFDDATLREMGQRASDVYHEHLAYGRWCPNALQELAA